MEGDQREMSARVRRYSLLSFYPSPFILCHSGICRSPPTRGLPSIAVRIRGTPTFLHAHSFLSTLL